MKSFEKTYFEPKKTIKMKSFETHILNQKKEEKKLKTIYQ